MSKYHTDRKGKSGAVAVLRTHARTQTHITIEYLEVNKNIYSQFFWIKDCIKYCFTKLQEIITGFISNTKQYIYMNEQICAQIVKIQNHIHQYNYPPSFYSFIHSLIFCEATQKKYL